MRIGRLMKSVNRRTWPVLAVAAVVGIAGAGCEYDPAAFAGNPSLSECQGVPATIGIGWAESDGASGSTYYGTEGDDVVVITNGPVVFYGLGGDDLICINRTGIASQNEDSLAIVNAGTGNDRIVNQADSGVAASPGPGADVYTSTGNGTDILLDSADGSYDHLDGGPSTDYVCGGDPEDDRLNFETQESSCGWGR